MSILTPGNKPRKPLNQNPVFARSGWSIPLENPPVGDATLIKLRAEELQKWHPKAEIRSVSTYPYNCVGMIFASRRAWIEIDYIYDIFRNDGYRQLPQSQVVAGDVVLYKQKQEPTHVALIVTAARVHPTSDTLNIQVLSKWGKDPEFIHFIEDVPSQLGLPSEFYTERQLP